ncbi:MAG: hypothetical protein JNJ46_26110 [Myxococcales bacterium]|nr:hypothetical protein [Myxococcales bacterium]
MTKNSAKQRVTKKMLAVEMYQKGMNILVIAELLRTEPSYVANALIERGYAPSYADLYTSTGPQNEYATLFKGLGGLRFKNLDSTRQSVARIEALYQRFKEASDRRGMHQCQVMALVGKNRASGIGKRAEAKLFSDWLRLRLDDEESSGGNQPAEPSAPRSASG